MDQPSRVPGSRRLVWVCPARLDGKLDAATWLETTKELEKLGWNVTLITAGPNGRHAVRGVEVLSLRVPDIYLMRYLIFHTRLLAHIFRNWQQIDVILFQPLSTPWVLLLRLAGFWKRGRRPLFAMDTRTLPMEMKVWRDKLRGHFTLLMGRIANSFADGQTAITSRMAEALHVPQAKLWGTWPSGVNAEAFASATALRAWPQTAEAVQLVYVGTLAPGRDLMPLCRAVEMANRQGAHFELSLVGDGEDRENLAAFAAHTNGQIRLLGRFPHQQIPDILGRMHVGALPFPDRQEFRVSSPIKLFEYLAAGLPVFATRISCHTDILDGQACVFWAEDSTVEGLAAGLQALWVDRASLADEGRVAARLAHQYTWAASARKFAAALEHGLATRGSDRG